MKGKLVRDNIPGIITKNEGKEPRTHILSSSAFLKELYRKLIEEAKEVEAAKKKEDVAMELADVEEVLEALKKALTISDATVAAIKKKKKKERGGFSKRIFLLS